MANRSLFPLAAAGLLCAGSPVLAAPAPAEISRRTETDGSRTLAHEIVVDASAADVWTAIATPEGWRSWAVPVAWTPPDDPDVIETSYDPAARPGAPGTIQQRVLLRVPNRILAFRTIKAPAGFPHWEAYRQVASVFELEPLGPARTRVRLTGAGYPAGAAGDAVLTFFERGNAASLEWLRLRFVDGPADWEKRLAARK